MTTNFLCIHHAGLIQANKVLEFLSVDVYETYICMKIRSFLMSGNLRMKRAHARDVDKKIFGLAYIYIYIIYTASLYAFKVTGMNKNVLKRHVLTQEFVINEQQHA